MPASVSIIVPTRNEAQVVGSCVERIFAACPQAEVLVVDGGDDDTEAVLAPHGRRWPRLRYLRNRPDRGKGHAVAVGVRESRGDLLAELDADLQFHPEELPRLLEPLRADRADLVLASRFLSTSTRAPGSVPGARGMGNRAISALASGLCGHWMSDVLAGMKAWRRAVTSSFTWESDGFSYEVELPIKALRRGFRVVEIPVTTEPRRTGSSSVRVLRTGAALVADMLWFRFGAPASRPRDEETSRSPR